MFARRFRPLQADNPEKAELSFVAEDISSNAFAISEAKIVIDLKQLVEWLELEQLKQLFALIVETTACGDLLTALEDNTVPSTNAANQLTERGFVLLDIFVERAKHLDRLPEEWEPDWVFTLRNDAERLHEAICEGRVDDADAILRDMVPDQNFRPVKAQQWLAAARNGQASLFPAAGGAADRQPGMFARPAGAPRASAEQA